MESDGLKVLCLLDVLGFENLLNSMGLKKLGEQYAKMTEYVKEQKGGIELIALPNGHVGFGMFDIGNAYFSDSLLFWTKYDLIWLPSFIRTISEMICYGVENGFPLRGTLTVGEMILDSSSDTYLGKPIIEAVRTERLQQWIGVSFGESFYKPDFNKGFPVNIVLPYKSHYKDKTSPLATGMVVDWARRWRESRGKGVHGLISAMDKDTEHSQYYKNTLDFVDFSERNHDWWKKQTHIDYG